MKKIIVGGIATAITAATVSSVVLFKKITEEQKDSIAIMADIFYMEHFIRFHMDKNDEYVVNEIESLSSQYKTIIEQCNPCSLSGVRKEKEQLLNLIDSYSTLYEKVTNSN